jgi:hypothetical protein
MRYSVSNCLNMQSGTDHGTQCLSALANRARHTSVFGEELSGQAAGEGAHK